MDQRTYFSAFGEVLLFIIVGILFILITLLVSRLIRPDRPNPEKLSTYESGEEPVSTAWSQFNIRFYVIALIFLLFEVEGFRHAEIATMLNISEAASKVALFQAKRELRALLARSGCAARNQR